MSIKLIIFSLLLTAFAITASAQRIVVDTASTNKYLLKPAEKTEKSEIQEEPTFGDRAISIGMGILNRLKARLNLDEAAESIKDKKEKILGKEEEKEGDG